MSLCIVVLEEKRSAYELREALAEISFPIRQYELIKPNLSQEKEKKTESSEEIIPQTNFNSIDFENVELLNPGLSRKRRQKSMANWLMPFGFIAGLSFTKMTGLMTFQDLGFPSQIENLISGLLGMCSGWIGSQVAAGNINPDINDDIKALRKKNEEGLWLLIIETPMEVELPWEKIRKINPSEIINLSNI